jgi:hypothetical protein
VTTTQPSDELTQLLRYVDQSGGPDACWPWTGSRGSGGYGAAYIRRDGRRIRNKAHRAVYQTLYGDLPRDVLVLHNCHNPICCNPAHLRPGSQLDNMADRQREGAGYARREAHYRALRLSDATIAAIRADYASGRGQHALAARYGISRSSVQRIVRRADRWKDPT